ncbi:T9SS type A sorting domain-containing protein [candidate division KSB1 bacterium]|nr:T9SS type A sorting domain-containing protein [candidate division KSB1 bacterium]
MRSVISVLLLALPLLAAPPAPPPSIFFVANEGQWDEPFAFKLSAGGTTYFVTEQGLTIDIRQYDRQEHVSPSGLPPYPMGGLRGEEEPQPVSVRGHVLKLNFVNPVSPHSVGGLRGVDKLASYSNYFLGRDSCRWRSRVGHYQRVMAKNVWPGIDVEFVAVGAASATGPGIKTNYHVHPGADASQIQIEYEGLDASLRVDGSGDLVLATSLGNLKEQAPWAYQIDGRQQRDVGVQFAVMNEHRYGVITSSIDASKELVIDPLIYSTYFGGNSWFEGGILALALDRLEQPVVAGYTSAINFPTTPGAYQTQLSSDSSDAYVTKFDVDARNLLFSTYLGGHREDSPDYLVVDTVGRPYVAGMTYSPDWPHSSNAPDTMFDEVRECFLARLSTGGDALEYSTFFGGSTLDQIEAMAIDSTGVVWFGGSTFSLDLPVSPDALITEPGDGFFCAFDPQAASINYVSYFPAHILRIDPLAGSRVWLSGTVARSREIPITSDAFQTINRGANDAGVHSEGFFARVAVNMSTVEYCSYIGGSGGELVAAYPLDASRILVYGRSRSTDYYVTSAAFDTSFNGQGDGILTIVELPSTLVASTYIGGPWDDGIVTKACYVDPSGRVVIGGYTGIGFPCTPDAIDSVTEPGWGDGFLARLSSDLSTLEYGTVIGGDHTESVFGLTGTCSDTVWLAGFTLSPDFPVTPDAYSTNPFAGWLMRFALPPLSAVERELPAQFAFEMLAYPNPFNSSARLKLKAPYDVVGWLNVFEINGRRVLSRRLHLSSSREVEINLDLSGLPSGTYLYTFNCNSTALAEKLFLIR